jgi:glycosyltransferase involved in cell wall biosynthesis
MTLHFGIIAPQFPPEIGGVQIYAYETVTELVRRGHRVTVFTLCHEGQKFLVPGAEIRPVLQGVLDLDRAQILAIVDDVDHWHVMNAAWAWVALHVRPVILTIFGNDFLSPNPVGGYRIRQRCNLPIGSTAESYFTNWNTNRLLRKALPHLKHIIAISEFTKAAFRGKFPRCSVNLSVGHVGVSDCFFGGQLPASKQGRRNKFISVTRLSERRKNIDVVLKSLAQLKDECSFTYTIVGDGSEKPKLMALTDRLTLASRVRFTGAISPDGLMAAYRSHDLFILTPSVTPKSLEGFGIVYLEANASGLPVLATRSCGAAEFIQKFNSGMIVDHPEVKLIGEALQSFMSGEVAISPEACRFCATQFRWPRIVDHTLRCHTLD